MGAALFLCSDSVIHDGLTTLIMLLRASEYCGKSLVVDKIWDTSSSRIFPSLFNSKTFPLCDSTIFCNYTILVSRQGSGVELWDGGLLGQSGTAEGPYSAQTRRHNARTWSPDLPL